MCIEHVYMYMYLSGGPCPHEAYALLPCCGVARQTPQRYVYIYIYSFIDVYIYISISIDRYIDIYVNK